MKANVKKTVLISAKLLITGGLMFWLFRKTNLHELGQQVAHARFSFLGLALLSNIIVMVVATGRWAALLKGQGIRPSGSLLLRAICAGVFLNAVLPGQTGGDLARLFYATQMAPDKKLGAALSVAVDRVMGLLGLLVVAGITIALFGHRLWAYPLAKRAMLVVLATGGAASIAVTLYLNQKRILALFPNVRWPKLSAGHRLAAPVEKIQNQLAEINEAYHGNRRSLAAALGLSLLVHVFSMLVVFLIGVALAIPNVPWQDYYLVMPVVNAVVSIPISIGGLGVRENMFSVMFGLVGMARESAVAMSLIYYGVNLVTSFIAGGVYLLAGGEASKLHVTEDAQA